MDGNTAGKKALNVVEIALIVGRRMTEMATRQRFWLYTFGCLAG